MTERRIYLDADRHASSSRKINIRAHRWYVTVELDRDGYVDAAKRRGDSPELPAAYSEAVTRAQNSSVDRLRYDGYLGMLSWSSGPSWVSLTVPFAHVGAAVEALRGAELRHDYIGLHALANRLALPIEDWLAPGERELVRGVDFPHHLACFCGFCVARPSSTEYASTAGQPWPVCGFARHCRSPKSRSGSCFPSSTPAGWTDGPDTLNRRTRLSGHGWVAEGRTSVTERPLSSSAMSRRRVAANAPAE